MGAVPRTLVLTFAPSATAEITHVRRVKAAGHPIREAVDDLPEVGQAGHDPPLSAAHGFVERTLAASEPRAELSGHLLEEPISVRRVHRDPASIELLQEARAGRALGHSPRYQPGAI